MTNSIVLSTDVRTAIMAKPSLLLIAMSITPAELVNKPDAVEMLEKGYVAVVKLCKEMEADEGAELSLKLMDLMDERANEFGTLVEIVDYAETCVLEWADADEIEKGKAAMTMLRTVANTIVFQ